MKKLIGLLICLVAMASAWAAVSWNTDAGGPPHWQLSGAGYSQVDVHVFANNGAAEIVASSGQQLEGLHLAKGEAAVIILPPGRWQWWTSDDGVRWRAQFMFASIAPECWRVNVVLGPRKSTQSWGRWTKL